MSNIVFGKLYSIHFDVSSSIINIGHQVQFRDFCQIRSGLDGKLTIGNRVFFNNECTINCFYKITIGNDCQFGEGVKFYDHHHIHNEKHKKINEQGYTFGEIIIGNNCWIASNVIILKSVTIGDNSVIGAGCVIYKSIPPNTILINKQEQIII